jgi:hypothetical protein
MGAEGGYVSGIRCLTSMEPPPGKSAVALDLLAEGLEAGA